VTKTDGVCRIDSVAVGELGLNLLGPSAVLNVKFALLNSESQDRLGYSNRNAQWSEETLKLIEGLVASIEKDILHDLFQDGKNMEIPGDTYTSQGDEVPGL